MMQIPRKMSAQIIMLSKGRAFGPRQDIRSANEVKLAGEVSNDKLYEPKDKQKAIRVLTVIAYIISVSMVAIILSMYYMYIWVPSDRRFVDQTGATKAPCEDEVTPMVLPISGDNRASSDERIEGK